MKKSKFLDMAPRAVITHLKSLLTGCESVQMSEERPKEGGYYDRWDGPGGEYSAWVPERKGSETTVVLIIKHKEINEGV